MRLADRLGPLRPQTNATDGGEDSNAATARIEAISSVAGWLSPLRALASTKVAPKDCSAEGASVEAGSPRASPRGSIVSEVVSARINFGPPAAAVSGPSSPAKKLQGSPKKGGGGAILSRRSSMALLRMGDFVNEVLSSRKPKYIIIEVTDTGVGIEKVRKYISILLLPILEIV